MTGVVLGSATALVLGGSAGGLVFGLIYFAVLRRTTALFGGGRRLAPTALTFVRIAGAIVFFGILAQHGAPPLLSAFLGFLLARTHALRAARSIA